ncbi:MAG: molybdenum cofactor biosynthesis protein MoaE [Bacteroidales bacterium]
MVKFNSEFLVEGPIKPAQIIEVYNNSKTENIGAHSVFNGQVRADIIDNQKVVAIEYTAYPHMVNNEMSDIIKSISHKFDDLKQIHILHSTGLLKVGEISLFVFVSSGHRKQAFRALEEIVELIKVRIPIWKKEIFENQIHRWPSNK